MATEKKKAKRKVKPTKVQKEILKVYLEDQLKTDYLDYSLADIYRSLPLDMDGLVVSQRRILYAMSMMKKRELFKSARVVGDTLGSFHPHGDQSVYKSMCRMAQNFKMLHPLIVAGGNFGSVDGDAPAAMRYTEACLDDFALDIVLNDELPLTEFRPNYDGRQKEPIWIPTKLPLVLINGNTGIGTGFAFNCPPHNLNEVCDIMIALVKKPNTKVEKLIELMPGPDSPTGGTVYMDKVKMAELFDGVKDKGHAAFNIPKVKIKDGSYGRYVVELHDIPFNMTTEAMIDNILKCHKNVKIPWELSSIRNMSTDSVMITFELKKGYSKGQAKKFVEYLIAKNKIRVMMSYSLQMFCHKENRPMRYNIRTYILRFINMRRMILTKLHKNIIKNAESNLMLLDALQDFINNRSEYLKILDKFSDRECKSKLMKKFKLTGKQVDFIMDSKIKSLQKKGMKVKGAIADNKKAISFSQKVLDNIDKYIISETKALRKLYGKRRKSKIISV